MFVRCYPLPPSDPVRATRLLGVPDRRPRENALFAAVARRLQADAHGYAAALLVAALAWGNTS